jgi:hypothetical protein
MGAIAIPKGQSYQKFKKDFRVWQGSFLRKGFSLLSFVLLIHFPSIWWGRGGAEGVGCQEGFLSLLSDAVLEVGYLRFWRRKARLGNGLALFMAVQMVSWGIPAFP